ncbi:hypothetical protein BT63DRAFT_470075 [Microthyrium microscopicum]|uniref:Sensor histidine kinase/response regulator n=1 Tax=Microthyrium microscopicum TaxID=703497 RepID=A0A6A6UF71_9PEZI|nr:hypothetical protein BT63DRAFT_470075 [Microthyrium microscopicum]
MGPDAVRERDLNRYYQPYKNAQSLKSYSPAVTPEENRHNSLWSIIPEDYKPQFSSDRALTAFAQLATLRLGVRRCIVSLIDSKNQYILTEATRTLSLSRHTIDNDDDKVWLGKSVLNRGDAMCENVLETTYTAYDEQGRPYTGDGLVVEDMTKDDRFKDKPFVLNEPCIQFYAGVPIRSRSGHTIGSYACSHNKPRPGGLTLEEFRFMQDMAETVMDHLEMLRDREDRTKGERMIRGLSEFIEGSCALGRPAPSQPNSYATKLAPLNGTPTTAVNTVLNRQTENLRTLEDDLESPPALVDTDGPSKLSGPKATKRVVQPPPSNPTCIFYRAADLIRKSTYADGAVFFRAIGPTLRAKIPDKNTSSDETSFDDSQSGTSGSETILSSASGKPVLSRGPRFTTQRPKKIKPTEREEVKHCEVLGLSISENAPGEDSLGVRDFQFSERSMEKYIKKFPYGKFFSFTEFGSGVSSGDDKSEHEPQSTEPASNGTINGHRLSNEVVKPGSKKRQSFLPTELLKILPGVRTLIFLPLWDPAAERWIAGGFIWTSKAGALLSPHNELPYLKAFGNSITSEYARMNALISDRAKSDFISSISHETRSPLHGILGSVEFLQETELSQYQAGLVTSVNTCAKTLLETLESILDYSKINKLYTRDRNQRRLETRLKKRDTENSIMGPAADVDLHQLLEEVAESVCAGHAFRETHNTGAGYPTENSKTPDSACNLRHVAVSLEIAPKMKNLVRTQPGAIRRIVMNLLGNSLKYTQNGYISVVMKAQQSPTDPTMADVEMTFADTGKGMSLEYQRTRMFSPFSQEDPFADGTGLGLSIVRQIVDSLGGHIDICSTKDVGTTVDVHLTLPLPENLPADEFTEVYNMAKGKKLSLAGANACPKYLGPCLKALQCNIEEWFGMELVPCPDSFDTINGDAVICHETLPDFNKMTLQGAPLIVVCKNQSNQVALRKHLLATLPQCARANIQIVAQPLGPQKLAGVLKNIFTNTQTIMPHPKAPISPPASPKKVQFLDPITESTNALGDDAQPPRPGPDPIPNEKMVTEEHHSSTAIGEPPKRASTEPVSNKEAPPQQPKRPVPIRFKSGLHHDNPPAAHHVLLVDDNAINLQLLTMFMRKIALPHASARDGLEALNKYKDCIACLGDTNNNNGETNDETNGATIDGANGTTQQNGAAKPPSAFTYVLMDISMPVMNGLESTRRIREFEREQGLKKAIIVALTGLASADAQQDALDAGVDFYLPKPVRFADLKRLMGL